MLRCAHDHVLSEGKVSWPFTMTGGISKTLNQVAPVAAWLELAYGAAGDM